QSVRPPARSEVDRRATGTGRRTARRRPALRLLPTRSGALSRGPRPAGNSAVPLGGAIPRDGAGPRRTRTVRAGRSPRGGPSRGLRRTAPLVAGAVRGGDRPTRRLR